MVRVRYHHQMPGVVGETVEDDVTVFRSEEDMHRRVVFDSPNAEDAAIVVVFFRAPQIRHSPRSPEVFHREAIVQQNEELGNCFDTVKLPG